MAAVILFKRTGMGADLAIKFLAGIFQTRHVQRKRGGGIVKRHFHKFQYALGTGDNRRSARNGALTIGVLCNRFEGVAVDERNVLGDHLVNVGLLDGIHVRLIDPDQVTVLIAQKHREGGLVEHRTQALNLFAKAPGIEHQFLGVTPFA